MHKEGSRISIFTGHFGSGKTEVAINYSIKLAKQNKKACIVDLDIVNPYFSVRESREYLEGLGIKVISPTIGITTAELSTVPTDVYLAFNEKSYEVVLDVGGDDIGAIALGQFNELFRQESYDMYFVINTNRPQTRDASSIVEYIKSIEKSSRLNVTYLINNTNLSYDTDISHIYKGQNIIKEVAERLSIPVRYTSIKRDLAQSLNVKDLVLGEIFELDIFMQPIWLNKGV